MIAELLETTKSDMALARQAAWVWPRWACTARIAGAYFDPTDDDAAIDARLDALLAQQVSVVLADSPWGQRYEVWVEDDKFHTVRALVAKVVRKAHERGLKIVLYQTGLELLSDGERNPGLEHPDWAQRSLDGRPILFNDVTTEQQHWVRKGIWDFWLSPCDSGLPGSFRQLSLSRVYDMAETGIDGLWVDEVYLQSSVGGHHELWPSSDACSADAFLAATGLQMPTAENWDDPVFRRWVIWRHSQINDFLLAVKEAARTANPDIVFFNENSDLDTGRSTYVANDPTSYQMYPDMSTGHEVEIVGFRMDEGQTGMRTANLDQWLSFRTMIAFARAADRGKPSWILTYGYEAADSARLAGMVLAEGACFYETKGPPMAGSVGASFRTELFRWIAEHEATLFGGESCAQVGLLYSPRTRDLVDNLSGQPYDVADSIHFAAYRTAANLLYRAHVPFDVVIDTDIVAFGRYQVLVAPEVQAMSDCTAAALHEFTGRLITIGATGRYDEWLTERSTPALAGATRKHFARASAWLVTAANTGLVRTDAPPSLQFGLHRRADGSDGYTLVLVNTGKRAAGAFGIHLQLMPSERITACRLSAFGGQSTDLPFRLTASGRAVHLDVRDGLNTVACLTLTTETCRSEAGKV